MTTSKAWPDLGRNDGFAERTNCCSVNQPWIHGLNADLTTLYTLKASLQKKEHISDSDGWLRKIQPFFVGDLDMDDTMMSKSNIQPQLWSPLEFLGRSRRV